MRLLLAGLLLTAAGCAGPTATIRELGHPVFEPVVGASSRFARAEKQRLGGLDAYQPDEVESG